jgi:hypothetical protein
MNFKFPLIFSVFILIFCQCKSSKVTFQKNPDFEISEAYAQGFVGGMPGNSGTNVVIQVLPIENIIPDSLYYQNRVSNIDVKPGDNGVLWVARFQKITRKEINIANETTEDVSIDVPEMENFPFELEKNEAVLLYYQNNTAYYYKIEGIKIKDTIYYPSARPK